MLQLLCDSGEPGDVAHGYCRTQFISKEAERIYFRVE